MIDGEKLRQEFAGRYGAEALGRAVLAAAPGRVNLIGEHTDYNEGFVLPIAVDFHLTMLGASRNDEFVRAYSLDFGQEILVDLREIEPAGGNWGDYLRGVLWALGGAGHRLRGMDLVIAGDVPQGAGLSSSAAFETATAVMAKEVSALNLPDLEMIRLCQKAENDYVGVRCGIMDQFISRMGRAGQALLLDCRDLTYSHHPLDPERMAVVVVNSRVKHELASSEYNKRRRECEEGLAVLRRSEPGLRALRDVSPALLAAHAADLDPVILRRCRHVVAEIGRVGRAVEALSVGDAAGFGALMFESHASLRDLYEVSCAELDTLVGLARGIEGVYGARMTGGGFGGCTVNLVRPDRVEAFADGIGKGYRERTGLDAEIYVCRAADGARIVGGD